MIAGAFGGTTTTCPAIERNKVVVSISASRRCRNKDRYRDSGNERRNENRAANASDKRLKETK